MNPSPILKRPRTAATGTVMNNLKTKNDENE